MSDCRKCANFDWCMENEECGLYKPKTMTNADRIRAMTDEELAEFLWSIGQNPGGWNYINGKPIFHSGKGNGWLDWLKQEVSE